MVRIYFDSRFGLTVHFEIVLNHASSNIFPEKGIEEGFDSCCLIEIFNYLSNLSPQQTGNRGKPSSVNSKNLSSAVLPM